MHIGYYEIYSIFNTMYQEIIDINRPISQLSNGIIQVIRSSRNYGIVFVNPQHISFQSYITFFDWGCLFDLYLQPITSYQTRITIQGRVQIGFDIFNIVVKKRWRGLFDIIKFSLQLNNNQIIYYYGSN